MLISTLKYLHAILPTNLAALVAITFTLTASRPKHQTAVLYSSSPLTGKNH